MKKNKIIMLPLLTAGIFLSGCTNSTPTTTETVTTAATTVTAESTAVESTVAETTAAQAPIAFEQITPETEKLTLGEMQIYDFNTMKVYAYQANDGLGDETILIENGESMIAIDPPAFTEQLNELLSYIEGKEKKVTDIILAYHPFGSAFFEGATVYSSAAIKDATAESGMGAGFAAAFGDSFAVDVAKADAVLTEGEITIGGIDMVIYPTADGCDIAVPVLNAIFVHMNGANTHSILGSLNNIDDLIVKLQAYETVGYDYVFTSHDKVETSEALTVKIQYLKETKEIAVSSANADAFAAAMNEAFPDYNGDNYLGMTTEALFPAGDDTVTQ